MMRNAIVHAVKSPIATYHRQCGITWNMLNSLPWREFWAYTKYAPCLCACVRPRNRTGVRSPGQRHKVSNCANRAALARLSKVHNGSIDAVRSRLRLHNNLSSKSFVMSQTVSIPRSYCASIPFKCVIFLSCCAHKETPKSFCCDLWSLLRCLLLSLAFITRFHSVSRIRQHKREQWPYNSKQYSILKLNVYDYMKFKNLRIFQDLLKDGNGTHAISFWCY